MRYLVVAIGTLLAALQPSHVSAQMLNDPSSRASSAPPRPIAPATGAKADARAGRLPPREVELPGSTFQAPAAGSPATVPFSVANPFSGGGGEQDMGIYRAITK
ncbi:MAG: hypothetical protein JWL84_3363 [Rhodospirillales bacterium]|jgi:hypothetical protein|nr:hypothetical protein [Rhodospirillales bacterium]